MSPVSKVLRTRHGSPVCVSPAEKIDGGGVVDHGPGRIILPVTIDRVSRSDQTQWLKKVLGRSWFFRNIDDDAAKTIPLEVSRKPTLVCFPISGGLSPDEIVREYESQGLRPAGVQALAKANLGMGLIHMTTSNATFWINPDGKMCYALFSTIACGEVSVHIGFVNDAAPCRKLKWCVGVR